MNSYIEVPSVLVTGMELVSPHLAWLIQNAAIEHAGSENIDLIAFRDTIPAKRFGIAYPPAKAIVINLEEHAYAAMDKCMGPEGMNASLRTLFIHEILDTAIHEADHLLSSAETGEWETEIEEEKAVAAGKSKSWKAAKHWSVNITTFGKYVDAIFDDFIASLREDAKEKVEMWRDLQIYMWDNNLGYYDPDKDLHLGMDATFEALAKDDEPWLAKPTEFIETLVPAVTEAPQPLPVEAEAPMAVPLAEMAAPVQQVATEEYYDMQYDISDAYAEMPPEPAPVVAQVTPPPVNIANGMVMNAQQIMEIAEKVLRTLFWHVQNKCEFNREGGYNNPTAVLEPVRIDHIPGALQLFTHMNTIDAQGRYANNQPTTNGIKGILTQEGMPAYKLFMNMGGALHYRLLLPANPNKITNGALSKWAQEARNGVRRMALWAEDRSSGAKADITLQPGQPLGQEVFNVWGAKR